jgi:hypothetical protein
MPTRDVLASFWRDWDQLSPKQQREFRATMALAERYGTRRLLTFDERHFRAVTPLQGGAFELLPADS